MIHLIIGPTASGKSALGIEIASKIFGCIINMDCMQIYKEIPIITAQPTKIDMQTVPHFLYGFAKNDEHFSFGKWLKMLQSTLDIAKNQGFEPIIVGGTMMYAYMLLTGFSEIPEISDEIRNEAIDLYENIGHDEFLNITQKMDENTPKDRQRLIYNYCLLKISGKNLEFYKSLPQKKLFEDEEIKIMVPQKTRKEVYDVCNSRFLDMIDDGLLDEISAVKNFIDLPISRATGFKYVVSYLNGQITKEFMVEKSQQETRNYAKKQIIWLRKFVNENLIDRDNVKIITD